MSRQKALDILNDKIDALILAGQTDSAEYKRLVRLHFQLLKAN